MISNDKELLVAALMRQKIIDTYNAIEDAGLDRFSDQSQNWLTRQNLKELIDELRNELCSLGAVSITAHEPCGARKHEKFEFWRWTLSDGRKDEDLMDDGNILVDGQIMEIDYRSISDHQPPPSREPCPCNPKKKSNEHRVVDYFIWPKDPDSKIRDLAKLQPQLADALQAAQDRRTRSSIREQLLLALIYLERLIINVTAAEEIEKRKKRLRART